MPPLAAVKALTYLAWMMVAFYLARASDASMAPALSADTPSAAPALSADTPSISQWHPLVCSMPACPSSGHIYLSVRLTVGLPVCTSACLHAYSIVRVCIQAWQPSVASFEVDPNLPGTSRRTANAVRENRSPGSGAILPSALNTCRRTWQERASTTSTSSHRRRRLRRRCCRRTKTKLSPSMSTSTAIHDICEWPCEFGETQKRRQIAPTIAGSLFTVSKPHKP